MQLSSGVADDGSPHSLHEQLSALFTTLGRAIADLERGGGLSRLEFSVLVHLARADGLRSTDLAEAEGLDPSTMSRRLSSLGDQGLVRREPDPDDGRSWRLHLTEEGRTRLRHVRDRRVALVTEALSGWAEEDRAKLAGLLGRLESALATRTRRTSRVVAE